MEERKILQIDQEFKELIPPLSKEEFNLLEENILKFGCIDPICTWNNTIIDGHNRYSICTKHNLKFNIQAFNFELREEAKDWICANQLGRRNISDETRKYLIGKRYEMEKILLNNPGGKNQYSKIYKENEEIKEERDRIHRPVTAIKLGKEYNVSTRTVLTYANYSKAIDKLNTEEPDLTQKILNGEIKVPQNQVIRISKLSPKIKNKIQKYLKKETNSTDYLIKPKTVANEKKYKIKEMHEYDPNAELVSLSFTIPSWIESLDRVLSLSKYKTATKDVKNKVKKELHNLEFSIGTMLLALEE